MSISTAPRIRRGAGPKKVLKRTTYKNAKPELLRDFESRCAYSMQHLNRAGGHKCMEIDHFDPRKKNDFIQEYNNLYLSTRHCNGSKRAVWPTASQMRAGLRYLDCCKEMDYGSHLFEDATTHRLIGVTTTGVFHIRSCDLNAPHLVNERRVRAKIWNSLRMAPVSVTASIESAPAVLAAMDLLTKQAREMIPEITPPPQGWTPPRPFSRSATQ
jgi:hypothetical protein